MIRASKHRVLALVVFACAGGLFGESFVGLGASHAECPVADVADVVRAQDSDGDGVTADRRGPADVDDAADMPAAPLALHEWGIWRLDRRGRVASLADLVRESPAFVHRAPDAAGARLVGPTPQRTPSMLETCDKPVIFLHAGTTMDVQISVRFPRGRPWLHFPEATIGNIDGVRTARWTGRVLADEILPEGRRYPDAPPGHWWAHLRHAAASPFVPASDASTASTASAGITGAGSTEAERFIFYDGETEFARGFRFRRRRPVPIAGRADPVAWIVDADGAARLAITGASMARTRLANVAALRADMHTELVGRGLTPGEVDALLDTWRGELFVEPEHRIVWMLPRSVYDAMLPLDVSPPPHTVVRVGLVIERL